MEQAGVFDLSAVDIRLLKLGSVVERYRQKYTIDGAEGMPPHVTLLYPFLSMRDYRQETQMLLSDIVETFTSFYLHLGGLRRFSGVLCIEVGPREPILHMIRRLVLDFPACLPYGGTIPIHELTPHITLATNPSEDTLDDIACSFTCETAHMRFEAVWVDAVSVSVRTSGRWRALASFQMGKR